MNAMTKAHKIRKEAAAKFNCKVSEIHFGECLRLAHKKEDIKTAAQTLEEITEEIAEALGGNVWAKYGKLRVYVYKNFLEVTDQGINISGLGRHQNEEMKEAAHAAASKHGLEVYEIYRGRKISAQN